MLSPVVVRGIVALFVVVFVVIGARAQAVRVPKTTFSCDGRTSGYYADVSLDCQVYHMCDGLGRQFSYRCPSKTLFQQRMLICDHWYMVNCSKAEEDYSANLLIGQKGKAFIEDRAFHRTPRPDLVDPGNSDYNTYNIGQQETQSNKNVVGAEERREPKATTDESNYFPPSHWSTEVPVAAPTSSIHNKREESGTAIPGFVKQIFYRTSYSTNRGLNSNNEAQEKQVDFNSDIRNGNDQITRSEEQRAPENTHTKESTINSLNAKTKEASIISQVSHRDVEPEKNEQVLPQQDSLPSSLNYPSSFKATTPVYPKHVDVDLSKFSDFANPLPEQQSQAQVSVNFPSKFKATTPVYPKHVDTDPSRLSEFDLPPAQHNQQKPVENVFVNFPSNFKATTPVYPLKVDVDPSKLSEFDILQSQQEEAQHITVNFPSKFKATTPVYPPHVDVDLSKFSGSEEVPPGQNSQEHHVVNFASNFKATTPVYPKQVDVDLSKFLEPVELPLEGTPVKNDSVNFVSKYKATTPVYPLSVESTSPIPDQVGLLPPLPALQKPGEVITAKNTNHVNFPSNFRATTPNYPTSVEPTSPDPNEAGLIVPQLSAKPNPEGPSLEIRPPNVHQIFSRRSDEYDPTVVGNTFTSNQLTEFMLTMKPEQLKDLRDLWHVPDYEFPLESVSRPSYTSDFSSFQAKPTKER